MRSITTAREYWEEVARHDYDDFVQSKKHLRHAMHAALSLYHLHEWVFEQFEDQPNKIFRCGNKICFVRYLDQNGHLDFELIREIANAHKHFILTHGTPTVANANQVSIRGSGWGQGRWGEGPFGGTPSIVIDLGNGQIRHFSAVAQNVYDMWDRLFRDQNW